ncbi:MAG TPA: hypothetical protein VMX58_00415 [Patescibacteria group bacterium]|nr:hypothetical protein [Patescibacteria group bacterium]
MNPNEGNSNAKRHGEMDRDVGRQELRNMLGSLAAARRAYLARGAVSVVLATGLALLSIAVALHALVPGWRLLPLVTFVLFWSGLAATFLFGALMRLLPVRNRIRLTHDLGARMERGGLFTAALEFSEAGDRLGAYSPYLMGETIRRASAALRNANSVALFADAGRPAWIVAAFCLACLLAVQVAFQGGEAGRAIAAVSDPLIYFRSPSGVNLHVVSSDRAVLEGGTVKAEAFTFGSATGEVTLRVSSIPDVWRKIQLEAETAMVDGMNVAAYRRAFNDVREDFRYYFETEHARTASRSVTVMHRPVINRISALLDAPPYTQAAPETVETLAGRVVALAGTRVTLRGETSKPLREGAVVFRGREPVPLAPSPGGFTAAFSISGDDTFTVEVRDSMGLASEGGISFPIVALDDRDPIVELLAPEDEALLPRSLAITLLYRAADDYGLASIDLRFTRDRKDKTYHSVSLMPAGARPLREIEGVYEWSLEDASVQPGDMILYYVEAYDANDATGPGHARTETRRLIVPSLSQIYADMRRDEAEQRQGMDEVLEEGREITERLQSLSEDLKADGTFDWSKRQEGKEILEKQRELQEKIREAAEQLDQTLRQLESNRMTTQDIGGKLEEIQRLLNRIESVELREAIERFNRMLGDVPEDEMMRAMKDIEMDADELAKRLDRTIELLEQVLKEEKMEELVRRMEEMLAEQRAVRDSTAAGDRQDVAGRQEKLGDEVDRFENDLSAFAGKEQDSLLQSDMEQIVRKMGEPSLEAAMRKAAGQIEEGKQEEAQCTQGGAMEQMLSLYTSLSRCQMCMSMAIEHEVIEAVERLTRELVTASKLEEDLIADVRGGDGESDRSGLITDQLVLKQAARTIVEDLYRLARRTMMIRGGVFQHLGVALAEIDHVLEGIEQKKFGDAANAAGMAYRGMNLAAVELLRSTASSGSSGGSAGSQMKMMLEKQMSIDQRLRQMFGQGDPKGWSMEERAGMARIAAEQRRTQELLERIAEESAGSGELLGRLDDVAGEMEEVAKRLERGGLDDELLGREERILSRMLESQRSVQRRDYKRERVSATADDLRALDPGTLDASGDDIEVLLEMIRRGMQEKGPEEYEELIHLYFRALSKQVREGVR